MIGLIVGESNLPYFIIDKLIKKKVVFKMHEKQKIFLDFIQKI
jgi:hypothetical protein